MSRTIPTRWLGASVALAVAAVSAYSPTSAQAAPSSPTAVAASEFGFAANAYGTQVQVGATLRSGPSALVTLGCTSTPGVMKTNTAASLSVAPFLTSGTINTSAASQTTATGIAATATATTQQVSALNGLVRATEVRSVSTTSHNSSTGDFRVSSAGTTFTGLTVAGVSITATPGANTRIDLPGFGYVILNQQSSHVGLTSASLRVIGLHIFVTAINPLVPTGTQIIVSSATSALNGPVVGLLSGLAYGTYAKVGTTLLAGQSFPQPMPCNGTNGVIRTNSGASVTIPGVLSTGTVSNTVQGTSDSTQVSGRVTSTVQNANLLAGTVTATAVHADVTATGNPPTLGDSSSFVGLTVAGFPTINANVAANTRLTLTGIGTLWLHHRIKTATSVTVVMIQLVITDASNRFGLSVGTTINVASATVGVR